MHQAEGEGGRSRTGLKVVAQRSGGIMACGSASRSRAESGLARSGLETTLE